VKRSCQRQTQVFDLPVRRMISLVPTPSALNRTISARLAAVKRELTWVRPSRAEVDVPQQSDVARIYNMPERTEEPATPLPEVAGSTARGLLLHKLIEEVLSGELQGGTQEIERRTLELLNQLGIKPSMTRKPGYLRQRLSAPSYGH
jgi:hypothetical protein